MPRKKTKKTGGPKTPRKRRSKKVEPENDIIREFGGWTIGDVAWGDKIGGGYVYGEIVRFHPDDSTSPSVSILDSVNGGFRTVRVDSLKENKPKAVRLRAKLSRK
mgnify:FL=1